MKMKLFLVSAVIALAASSSQGAVIVSWDLTGKAGNEVSDAATSAALHITGLSITRGAGLAASAAGNAFSSTGWDTTTADDYISLGFTVDAGFAVDLTDFIFATQSSAT